MDSDHEDWDLDGILTDIWSAASPSDSSWPWLSSSASRSRQRRPPPAEPPSTTPPSALHLHFDPIHHHHHSLHHLDGHAFSADSNTVVYPSSIEWRAEVPPPVEAVTRNFEVSIVEEFTEAPPKQAEEEKQDGADAGRTEKEEEEQEKERQQKKAAQPQQQQDGGRSKWRSYIPPISLALWRKVGAEMVEKIDKLEENPRWLMLQNLTEREDIEGRRLSAQRRRVRRRKTEMYGTLEIYAVLQGVIYAAVADTSLFSCRDIWGPIILVAVVTIVTLIGMYDRYIKMRRLSGTLRCMEKRMRELKKVTKKLKQNVLDDKADPIDLDALSEAIPRSLYSLDDDGEIEDVGGGGNGGGGGYFRQFVALMLALSVGAMNIGSCIKILCPSSSSSCSC